MVSCVRGFFVPPDLSVRVAGQRTNNKAHPRIHRNEVIRKAAEYSDAKIVKRIDLLDLRLQDREDKFLAQLCVCWLLLLCVQTGGQQEMKTETKRL